MGLGEKIIFRRGLGRKITLFFLITGLLPLLILGLSFLTYVKQSLNNMVSENLLALTKQVGTEIDRSIFNAYMNIKTLAASPGIRSNFTDADEKLAEMRRVQDFYKVFEDITLIDLTGNVITSTTYNYRGSWNSKSWYRKAREGRAVVSNVHIILNPKKFIFVTTAPVLNKAGRVQAVVAGQVNMGKIWDITDRVRVGRTGFMFMINKEGVIIAYPDKEKIFDKLSPDTLRQHVLHNPQGTLDFTGGQKVERICAYSSLKGYLDFPGKEWKVGICQRTDEAYDIIKRTHWQLQIATLAGLLAIILTSILLTWSITKPIKALVMGTEEVARGNLNYLAEVKGDDEIGQLGQSFNRMTQDLKRSREEIKGHSKTLEDKVRERTIELEAANARLKELDQIKTNFLSTVSHELRTPLTSIKAFSEILLDNAGEDMETQTKFLNIINEESDRLARLIDDLLDLSRIESGRQVWRMGYHHIEGVIDESVAAMSSLAEKKGLVIDKKVQEGLPEIYGDRDKLDQVVTNLLGNAIKFTDNDGLITVSAAVSEDRVRVAVADNGIGIPEDELDKVFMKFHQVDSSATRKKGGTGLGLAICKEIIEHHGGKIWVESQLGEGSTFYFIVPQYKEI
jgi:signal transduction histidine kinase